MVLGLGVAQAGDTREVRGRVVDEQGRPVAGADVSYTWRANGPYYDQNGKPLDGSTVEARKVLWGRVGQWRLWAISLLRPTTTDALC